MDLSPRTPHGKSRQISVLTALTAALSIFAISGCAPAGSDNSKTVVAGVRPSAEAGLRPLGTASKERKTEQAEEPGHLLVTNVRLGSHSDFDRIVFDLTGQGRPGWSSDFATTVNQPGTGTPVAFNGEVALVVTIDGTAYPFEMGLADPKIGTVPGVGNILEVQSLGTYEGRSEFIIGLPSETAYSIELLESPKRVVLDVMHP